MKDLILPFSIPNKVSNIKNFEHEIGKVDGVEVTRALIETFAMFIVEYLINL